VSFYNQSKDRSVAPSAIVSCTGKVDDVKKAITMSLKSLGNKIYLLGQRKDELGGSAFYNLMGQKGLPEEVPVPNYEELKGQVKTLVESVNKEYIASAHDISDGGLVGCLAEMVLGGNGVGKVGANINLDCLDSDLELDTLLFSETGGFVVEVNKENEKEFIKICKKHKIDIFDIGVVTGEDLDISLGDEKIFFSREELQKSWLGGLLSKLNE
jgi:phosphoribosylformylglycinamidine synthase